MAFYFHSAVDEFLLYDTVAETKYRMKLSEALTRAKENKGTLLRNKTFYVTMKTKVEYKLLKNVVTAHGGQVGFHFHIPPDAFSSMDIFI